MTVIYKHGKHVYKLLHLFLLFLSEDALKAFQTNISLLALGRELIIDPNWVQKVQAGKEKDIVTELDKNKQEERATPTPLWNAIISAPGWFPGV